LQQIFDSWDQSYILPPLNRFLLPFHQEQRFRSVSLGPKNYRSFKAVLDRNESLKVLVREVELEVLPLTDRNRIQLSPTRQELSTLLASLDNLRSFTLKAPGQCIEKLLPAAEQFKLNSKLESLLARPWTRVPNGSQLWLNAFDDSVTRYVNGDQDLEIMVGEAVTGVVDDPMIFEIKRGKRSTFSVRYCTRRMLSQGLFDLLATFPVTHLDLVMLVPLSTLPKILSTSIEPSRLSRLSLTVLLPVNVDPLLSLELLASFTGLSYLSFSGGVFPSSPELYDTLRHLPLSTLAFGPDTDVDVQALTSLFSTRIQPNLSGLKQLVLSNFNADTPEDEEDVEFDEWIIPDWTRRCSKEGVEKLRIIAGDSGIETAGSTFLGLDIEDSEAYQAAIERSEEVESEEESEEEEEEEEEDYSEGYDSEDSDFHEEEHERSCGCHRSYDYCWDYSDSQGWPRRFGRRY